MEEEWDGALNSSDALTSSGEPGSNGEWKLTCAQSSCGVLNSSDASWCDDLS